MENYSEEILNLENSIKEQQDKLDALKKQQSLFEQLPKEYQLATLIHAKICRLSHDDQCGWEFTNIWSDSSRKPYVDNAKKILKEVDFDNAVKVIRLLI